MIFNTHTVSVLAILLGFGGVALVILNSQTPTLADNQITIQRLHAHDRHLYGSPDAATVIVEFSDYQCPFCARLHPDLKTIVDESDGSIAWEYRHLPLGSHSLAVPGALMSECVHEKLGNTAFWQFTDDLLINQAKLSHAYILEAAKRIGLPESDIEQCAADEQLHERITLDTAAAVALGGAGTPFSVIVYPDNTYKPVVGAVPEQQWASLVNLHAE